MGNKDYSIEEWEEPNIKREEEILFSKAEEEIQNKKSKKIAAIVFLVAAIVFFIFSILPYTNYAVKISGISLSILFFFVFLFLILSKRKEKDKKLVCIEDKIILKEENNIGMKETVFFNACEEYLKLQWKEKGRQKQYVLREFPCTVGKIKEEVSVVISDLSVSRIHCRFIEKDHKVCVMDLNSTNGTFLNGLPVKNGEILEIEKNDEIHVGKVKLSVV